VGAQARSTHISKDARIGINYLSRLGGLLAALVGGYICVAARAEIVG
jgi:hypothetical protein